MCRHPPIIQYEPALNMSPDVPRCLYTMVLVFMAQGPNRVWPSPEVRFCPLNTAGGKKSLMCDWTVNKATCESSRHLPRVLLHSCETTCICGIASLSLFVRSASRGLAFQNWPALTFVVEKALKGEVKGPRVRGWGERRTHSRNLLNAWNTLNKNDH